MHVSSDRDPVEIKGRDSVLSVGGIFLYRKLIHVEGILRGYFRGQCCVWGENSHMLQLEDPGETAQGNRRLGGLKEDICVVYFVYEQQ